MDLIKVLSISILVCFFVCLLLCHLIIQYLRRKDRHEYLQFDPLLDLHPDYATFTL